MKEHNFNTESMGIQEKDLLKGSFPETHSPGKNERINWLLMQLEVFRLNFGEKREDIVPYIKRMLDNLFFNVWHLAEEKLSDKEKKELLEIRERAEKEFNNDEKRIQSYKGGSSERIVLSIGNKEERIYYFLDNTIKTLRSYELVLRKTIDKVM